VLHATPFVGRTLRNCAKLLCPGGLLLVNEATHADMFAQITFGLTDGWWRFAESRDPERIGQASPLMTWRQWEGLFSDSGFGQRSAGNQVQGALGVKTIGSCRCASPWMWAIRIQRLGSPKACTRARTWDALPARPSEAAHTEGPNVPAGAPITRVPYL
jgi:hypothetical protein